MNRTFEYSVDYSRSLTKRLHNLNTCTTMYLWKVRSLIQENRKRMVKKIMDNRIDAFLCILSIDAALRS